jgi:hypothetical protein
MKKLCLFSLAAGLTLISAAPPPPAPGNLSHEIGRSYPECSRLVTDRCIQLYERGVSVPANLEKNGGLPAPTRVALRHSGDPKVKRELTSGVTSKFKSARAAQPSQLDPAWEAQQVRRMREGGYLILPPTNSAKKLAEGPRRSTRCS